MTLCTSKDGRAGTGHDGANVLGVRFDFTDYADVVKTIGLWRACGERRYISITNPHSVMVCRRDREMGRATAGAALTVPNGVGVIWAARILGYPNHGRVAGFADASEPRGACLAGFGPSPARRMFRATVSLWIPNSRAIRRAGQRKLCNDNMVCTKSILRRFAIRSLLPSRLSGNERAYRCSATFPQNGWFSSAPYWPVLSAP